MITLSSSSMSMNLHSTFSALSLDLTASVSMVVSFLARVSYLFSDSVRVYWASFSWVSRLSLFSLFLAQIWKTQVYCWDFENM